MFKRPWLILTVALFSGESVGLAEPEVAAQAYPRVGGHFNLAVPIVSFGSSTEVIGSDFYKLGLAPGVTVKLDDRWAIDFEFVAYNNFKTGGTTSLVIDPGVLYNFGPAIAGLRTAVSIEPAQNWGFIPIVVKTFPAGLVRWLIELDLPIFIYADRTVVTIQPQLGVAF